MEILAKKTSKGSFSSFNAVFGLSPLSTEEHTQLKELLVNFGNTTANVETDLQTLSILTQEVKAINHQAILLHGERIKKAQKLLKSYQEGAFSAWLIHTYGNRQTPYNFLQYYELHAHIPDPLHKKLEHMPKQVVYALASRKGDLNTKIQLIDNYSNQSKQELLNLIRKNFPLDISDQRAIKPFSHLITLLQKVCDSLDNHPMSIQIDQKKQVNLLIKNLQSRLKKSYK